VLRATAVATTLLCAVCSRALSPLSVREEPVRFSSGDATLAGTLFIPDQPGRHPAVVLFHGSGPQERDSYRGRWFANWGITALAYDKRGTGESTGDYRKVPFQDLVEDGLAGIALLKTRSDVDLKRIGVWGQSQGGWLGPLAAARSSDVAFVIAVSGPGVTPGEQMIFYYASELRNRGYSDQEISRASDVRRQVWSYMATGDGYERANSAIQRAKRERWYADLCAQQDDLIATFEHATSDRNQNWFKSEMNYDPVATLKKLKVPVLFLFGSQDRLVPVPTSVEIIQQTLSADSHQDFTVKVFPGADHGLSVVDASGSSRLAPGYEDTMKEWLLRHVR